jgi:transcription-repair coupling factor (superfamily II helicase)
MEKSSPMDRVIMGDVGYGKTEIAVRAAFKAVQDGKQVAVLVPTTLLVQQHYGTFRDRFQAFPVKVRAVSRFNSDKEQKEVMDGVKDGSVDVVIGTHRLLSKDTQFKDLGLVIVDEEQRFGVEHKEFIKQMRTAVDVLTMSATPIPRTLEMSLTGIREMSTILTPPEERHPVLTFVGPYDEKQISAAIRRELLREGQVFFVHNRVESIDRVAKRIRELVPEARTATGHGQMGEAELEQVMVGFWEKDYDVLVCTTIVESGLDIPNANTLIVDRADAFGLSQLHQIRGRVGRGRERAYAYFTYQPDKPLTELAHDRLATIAQNTEVGAGMAVAMKDLEIRGAGNLLGGEQSGHIASVGFDLYMRLVGEAVSDFKRGGAGAEDEVPDTKVDLPVDAHLPHDYIPGERLRLEAYRRLASAYDDAPSPPSARSWPTATARCPTRSSGCSPSRRSARTPAVRPHRGQRAGHHVRFAPAAAAGVADDAAAAALPALAGQAGDRHGARPAARRRRASAARPLRDTALLDWARDLLDAVLGESVGRPRRAAARLHVTAGSRWPTAVWQPVPERHPAAGRTACSDPHRPAAGRRAGLAGLAASGCGTALRRAGRPPSSGRAHLHRRRGAWSTAAADPARAAVRRRPRRLSSARCLARSSTRGAREAAGRRRHGDPRRRRRQLAQFAEQAAAARRSRAGRRRAASPRSTCRRSSATSCSSASSATPSPRTSTCRARSSRASTRRTSRSTTR